MNDVAASYAVCRDMARRSASNFAWAFWLLPRQKRMAMQALYAFLRRTDDLGDSEQPVAHRKAALASWRELFERALGGTFGDPLLPALVDTIRQFAIPVEHLRAAIDGVEMDCVEETPDKPRFAKFAELENYCEHVASAVGLSCIHIWGFSDPAAVEPARQCGIAFQLTNILRDLKEDADHGRIYLPREDFDRFGYAPADLQRGVRDSHFLELMRFEIARTEEFYSHAAALDQYLDPVGKRMFGAMVTTYRGLLEKIKALEGDVLDHRVRLSRLQKLQIAGQWLLFRPRLSLPKSTPGVQP